MTKKELVSHKKMQSENGNSFRVEYFITKESGKLNELEPGYGLLIEKLEMDAVEIYEAPCCFHEYAPAYAMAEKLSRYSVTPSGAEETIESLLEYLNR